DINSRHGYEAAEVLAIYNPQDEWIGDSSRCGVPPYTLAGAEMHLFSRSFHVDVLWKSAKEQLALIRRKYEVDNLLEDMQVEAEEARTPPSPNHPTWWYYSIRRDLLHRHNWWY
ncbi:unnamed protein product, partial [Mesorhabditis spiculigera]